MTWPRLRMRINSSFGTSSLSIITSCEKKWDVENANVAIMAYMFPIAGVSRKRLMQVMVSMSLCIFSFGVVMHFRYGFVLLIFMSVWSFNFDFRRRYRLAGAETNFTYRVVVYIVKLAGTKVTSRRASSHQVWVSKKKLPIWVISYSRILQQCHLHTASTIYVLLHLLFSMTSITETSCICIESEIWLDYTTVVIGVGRY